MGSLEPNEAANPVFAGCGVLHDGSAWAGIGNLGALMSLAHWFPAEPLPYGDSLIKDAVRVAGTG